MWHDKPRPVCFISSARGREGSDLEKNQNVMNGLHERCVYPRSTTEKESGEPPENAINHMDVSSDFSPMTSAITKTQFQRQEIDAVTQGETNRRLVGGGVGGPSNNMITNN